MHCTESNPRILCAENSSTEETFGQKPRDDTNDKCIGKGKHAEDRANILCHFVTVRNFLEAVKRREKACIKLVGKLYYVCLFPESFMLNFTRAIIFLLGN